MLACEINGIQTSRRFFLFFFLGFGGGGGGWDIDSGPSTELDWEAGLNDCFQNQHYGASIFLVDFRPSKGLRSRRMHRERDLVLAKISTVVRT